MESWVMIRGERFRIPNIFRGNQNRIVQVLKFKEPKPKMQVPVPFPGTL
ncbi:hypothetical protein Patl1_07640 [Pistacia atlantica]|uniref:Uncharacterized protein n=1 Tax=Pistacia atlantica TaxID=434234 RepID=A0ACC1AKC1_9ROSI|nr:hypothetical protein Patl1_07640 [Pistacia atlantica]